MSRKIKIYGKTIQKKPDKNAGFLSVFQKFQLWFLLLGTALALIPQAYIRSSYNIFYYLFTRFRTYPGDLWYCWNHYLSRGFAYPREYPAGIQLIFKIIFRFKPLIKHYETYFIFMVLFLGIFALLSTFILYNLVKGGHKQYRRIWIYWILAPTFMFYGLINLDFLPVFAMLLSYFLFTDEEYYMAAAAMAIGAAIKVYPAFLAPLYFFECPKKYRLGSVLSFILVWVFFNGPSMITEWSAWSYPYHWQINYNFAKTATDGSFWWLFHHFLGFSGPLIGRLSLLLFLGLMGWFLKNRWHLPLASRGAGVMLLFILTDRIYSPQYNLYLLPFLALLDFDVDLRLFYTMGITNVVHVMFLFFFKEQPLFYPGLYLQGVVFIKYAAMIMIFMQICNGGIPPWPLKQKDSTDPRQKEIKPLQDNVG